MPCNTGDFSNRLTKQWVGTWSSRRIKRQTSIKIAFWNLSKSQTRTSSSEHQRLFSQDEMADPASEELLEVLSSNLLPGSETVVPL